MVEHRSVRNVFLACVTNAIQTTPYIVTAGLIPIFGVLPLLGATLVLALGVMLVVRTLASVNGHAKGRPTSPNAKGVSIMTLGAFLTLACWNWLGVFLTIRQLGATAGVVAALASAIGTMWMGQFVMRSSHHRARSFGALSIASVLLALAVLAIAKSKVVSNDWRVPDSVQDMFSNTWPVAIMIATSVSMALLKPILTDAKEAEQTGRGVVRADTLMCLELAVAAVVVVAANIVVDQGQQLLAIVPASLDPSTWSSAHWGLVWVGTVNTALAALFLTKLTNVIGVPIAMAVGQGRPMIAELMQSMVGMTVMTALGFIDMLTATALLVTVGRILWEPPKQ